MGKRFRDTEIWTRPWFRKLDPVLKCAWDYILDRCDSVGVWIPDCEAAEFHIGKAVDWEELREEANGNIRTLDSGKWWIQDFCKFQYGKVHAESDSKVQQNLHSLLLRHGIWEEYLSTVAPTVQEKEKEKVKEKEKETYAEGVRMTRAEYSGLVARYGEAVIKLAIEKVAAQQIKKKMLYPSPRGAIQQWGIRAALEELKKSKGDGIDRSPAQHPPCDVCGKECVRGVGGYWDCPEHGRRENVS